MENNSTTKSLFPSVLLTKHFIIQTVNYLYSQIYIYISDIKHGNKSKIFIKLKNDENIISKYIMDYRKYIIGLINIL